MTEVFCPETAAGEYRAGIERDPTTKGGMMDRRTFMKLALAGAAVGATQGIFSLGALAAQAEDPLWFMQGAPQYTISDAHFHFVDFLQHTDGMDALVQAMNANGVQHIMISGMPLVKKWDKDDPVAPKYYLDNTSRAYWYSATDYRVAHAVQRLPDDLRFRFHPYICGFNGTDKYAVEHVQRMLDEFPGLWQGVGEIFGHRDDLTNMTYGENARANHAALDPVYDLAGRNDMPVNLHNNCTSRSQTKEWRYVYEVEGALKNHPKTRIVWAHAGLSRLMEDIDQRAYTAMLRKMLEKYPNLWLDLSWIVYEEYMTGGTPQLVVRPCWLQLVKDFPDRFMVGSDSIGHMGTYAMNIRKYYTLFRALPADTARKVARDNFLSILPKNVRETLPQT